MPDSSYLGNDNRKGEGTIIGFTEDQLLELQKCADDPKYFILNYVKIIDVNFPDPVPFTMYPFQEKIVDLYHNNRFTILKLPRQMGKTSVSMAYVLHYIIFNPNVKVALLANKGATARDELLGRLQLSYELLPQWMQQGIVSWNKGSMKLENGSIVRASATSASAIRGGSYNLIFLDEFAHVVENVAEEFYKSVYPTISSGKTTKLIIVSTPKGMNLFYKFWVDAENGRNKFVPFTANWQDHPNRDEEWHQETLLNLDEASFLQEYCCEFFGSSNTLISPTAMKILASMYTKPIFTQEHLDVYEEPKMDQSTTPTGVVIQTPRKYVIVADTAKGKFLDYSAFVVIDITEIPYKVVAKYRNNGISVIQYPNVVYNVAKKYNEAFVLLEINDAGNQVASALINDLEYDNVLSVTPSGRGGQHLCTGFAKNQQYGLTMTSPVKIIGCTNLKTMIEKQKLMVYDYDIIQELTNFVRTGKSFAADEGKNDDLVMCLVIFAWMAQDRHFRELVDHDLREKMSQENEEEMEFSRLPFGFILNGLDEHREGVVMDGDVWFFGGRFDGYKNRSPY